MRACFAANTNCGFAAKQDARQTNNPNKKWTDATDAYMLHTGSFLQYVALGDQELVEVAMLLSVAGSLLNFCTCNAIGEETRVVAVNDGGLSFGSYCSWFCC